MVSDNLSDALHWGINSVWVAEYVSYYSLIFKENEPVRHEPVQAAQKSKLIMRFVLGILTIFCSKRGTKGFTAGETSSARRIQLSAGNRFMPHFVRYFGLNFIHD